VDLSILRCNKCRETGHIVQNCTRPRRKFGLLAIRKRSDLSARTSCRLSTSASVISTSADVIDTWMEGVEEAQTEEGKVEKGQTGSSAEKGKEREVDTWMRGSQEAQTKEGKVEEGQTGGSARKDKGREARDYRGWGGVVE
jgi:hypothetical protein